MERTFAIVGAGLAGARAAATLREEGFDGRVVLLGEEVERPYFRPPLSKGYLAGRTERKNVYVHPEEFYAAHEIELRTATPVEALDLAAAEIVLADGGRIGYDRLLLATGASPRALPVPGAELDGVLLLRRVEQSDAIRERIDQGARLVIVGGGWIGAEVAATARSKGCEVAMVYPTGAPLEHVLGPEVATAFARLHEAHGVELHPGASVASIEGDGSVSGVRLEDGRTLEADAVVAGIGVTPRIELAERAGLEIDNGIAVDARLRTADERVWAAGDVAAVAHPFFGRRIRVEHWAVAREQGPFAARSMLGSDDEYDSLPYFFTDQYDANLEYWGLAQKWDEVVVRGDSAGGRFLAFWLADGRVLAGAGFNSPGVGAAIQGLIRSREAVDPAALADPSTPLPGVGSAPVELAPGEGAVIERGDDSVAVARDAAGGLHAVSAICTHVGCLVEWEPSDGIWHCPCHGSEFSIEGKVLQGPAEEPLHPREL